MTEEKQNAPFDIEEMNGAWGRLLSQITSQYITENLVLRKEIERLQALEQDNQDLKAQLHQAQIDLLAAQGKAVIDAGR
jgi:hypothetical protein